MPTQTDGRLVPGHLESAAQAASRAVSYARGELGGRSGPVHLNAPYREPLWSEGWAPSVGEPSTGEVAPPPRSFSAPVVKALAYQLQSAARGVIYCGALEPREHDIPKLVSAIASLSQKLGWPILAEPTSQLRFGGEAMGYVVSTYDVILRSPQCSQFFAPDFVLRIWACALSQAYTANGWQSTPMDACA